MGATTYHDRRGRLQTYCDATATDAWAQLTSQEPVSKIRATVRAGRDRMRETLLSWLPESLSTRRLLDAGCGTGALAVEAARRGAHVTAVDIAGNLVRIARERAPTRLSPGHLSFHVGDMADPALGGFDHVVAMDSLIHYPPSEMLRVLAGLAPRTTGSMLATFAPRTPALTAMHAVGQLFPRSDRAPAIEPVSEAHLRRIIAAEPALAGWRIGRTARIASSFYISQALELVPR